MEQMLDLDTLAWVVGCLNPLSALLVGPALAGLIGARTHTTRTAIVGWAQGTGWLLLALAQTAFLAYGWVSGHAGFRWAQAAMIPVAAANFAAWLLARRTVPRLAHAADSPPPDPVDAMLQAIQTAQTAGRVRVEHRTDIGPGIPTSRPEITATAIRLVPLDADGKPTGTPRHITGPVSIHLGDATVQGYQQARRDLFPDDLDDDPYTEKPCITIPCPDADPAELCDQRPTPGDHQTIPYAPGRGPIRYPHKPQLDTQRMADALDIPAELLEPHNTRPTLIDDHVRNAILAEHRHWYDAVARAFAQLVDGSTPVEEPMEERCRTPIFDASLSAPERCAEREGHEGDCAL